MALELITLSTSKKKSKKNPAQHNFQNILRQIKLSLKKRERKIGKYSDNNFFNLIVTNLKD